MSFCFLLRNFLENLRFQLFIHKRFSSLVNIQTTTFHRIFLSWAWDFLIIFWHAWASVAAKRSSGADLILSHLCRRFFMLWVQCVDSINIDEFKLSSQQSTFSLFDVLIALCLRHIAQRFPARSTVNRCLSLQSNKKFVKIVYLLNHVSI